MSEDTEEEEKDGFQIGLSVKNGDMKFSIGFEADDPLDILEEIDKAMNPPIDNRGV